MDIAPLKEKLSDINRRGYVVSLRKGNTGIGYTLETLLGVAENNLRSPDLGIELRETLLGVAENNLRYSDLGNIELKSRRIKSTSLLTMFTFNDSIWKIEQEELIRQYGYYKNGRWALYTTVKNKPNSRGFYVKIEQNYVDLRMHIAKNGVVRNHGTAFRLHRRYWDSCFNNAERLL